MIIFVHGYEGPGEGHWQVLLHRELSARGIPSLFPELPEPLAPQRDRWVEKLAGCAASAGDRRVFFICHSLGCWAFDHLLESGAAPNAHGAFLVSPPSPFLLFEAVQSFLPPPLSRSTWEPIAERSLLVGSDDDDYAGSDEHAEMAGTLGIEHRIVTGGGHINTESGFGTWPLPLEWLEAVGGLGEADAP